MKVLVLIGIVILMIINLSIYHKVFNVIYFDFGKGCFMELFFAGLVAMFEIGIVLTIGKYIVGALFKLLGFAGQLIFIILVIALVVFIVWKIVQMVKGKADMEELNKANNDLVQNKKLDERKELEDREQDFEVTDTNVGMEKFDIELTEVGSNRVRVIKAVCEITGLRLAEAKDLVDSSPKILKRVSKEEANNIKSKLEAEGAKVVFKLVQEGEAVSDIKDNIHMIVCANCGKMIDEGAKFCSYCGGKIERTICEKCGKKILPNSNFCSYCGEKLLDS